MQQPIMRKVIRENYKVLSRSLDVSKELLFRLLFVDFMEDKVRQIEEQLSPRDKTEQLLRIISQVPGYQENEFLDDFLSALREVGQEHVANIFRSESEARPLTDEHYRLLDAKQQEICQCLDPLNGLVDELVRREVITGTDRSIIMSKVGHDDVSRETIRIFLQKPDSAFRQLIGALCATNLEHVAGLLGYATSKVPMTAAHRDLLISRRPDLCQFIDPSYELLNDLVRVGVFTDRDVNFVRAKTSYYEMCFVLINILLRKSECCFGKFVEALENADQRHVVHILTGQGESPLSHIRRLVLNKARKDFIAKVDIMYTSFVPELISSGVLSSADKQLIEAEQTNECRNSQLLDIVARKSQLAYDKFIKALKDSSHCQVAAALEGLELRARIDPHFRSDVPTSEQNRIIRMVSSKMEEALISGKEGTIDEITTLMEQNGFAISRVCLGSILISFRCFNAMSVVNLKRLYNNGTLDKLFTEAFCPEFVAGGLESLTFYISDDEFENRTAACTTVDEKVNFVTRRDSRPTSDQVLSISANVMNGFPVEMLEIVLLKVINKSGNYKDAYTTLASVCYSWRQTLNGERPESSTGHLFSQRLRSCDKSARAVAPSPGQAEAADQRKQCVVFIDDSNLYIEGQKYFARLHNLLVSRDPRCHINIRKLLDIVLNGREMCPGSVWYASEPPARDTVCTRTPKSAIVKMHHKNMKETDEEVATVLTADAIAYTCKHMDKSGHQTVVVVAGDQDYCPLVMNITKRGWNVEVLAFSSSISGNMEKMRSERCKLFKLDGLLKIFDSWCFIETRWFIEKCPLPANATQVIKLDNELDPETDKPKIKKLVYEIVAITHVPICYHLTRKNRKLVFIIGYLPNADSETAEKLRTQHNVNRAVEEQDEEEEEEETHAIKVLSTASGQQIKKQAGSTTRPDFISIWNRRRKGIEEKCREIGIGNRVRFTDLVTFRQSTQNVEKVQLGNRFSVLNEGNGESDSDDDENTVHLREGNIAERASDKKSDDEEGDTQEDSVAGFVDVRKRSKTKERVYPITCRHHFSCRKGSQCHYKHSPVEMAFFKMHGGNGVSGYKSKPCHHYICRRCQYGIKDIAPMCQYYHSTKEAHCNKCKMIGHAAHDQIGPVCSTEVLDIGH